MSPYERHVNLHGARLLVREVGSGQPVVLLNGIGAHVEMWRALEGALDGVRLISFDAPGTGRSGTSMLPYTMGGLAGLVERLLDRLGLERVDVVGYSFGGALGQQLAAVAPERVRRLVLAATVPGWGGVPGRLPAMLTMGTPLRYYSRSFYEATAPTIAGGRTRRDRAHVRRLWGDRVGHAPSPLGYAQQVWAMSAWSGLPLLHRIEAPTLVVVGDDDPLVPVSNALILAAGIPRARAFVAAGEGHFQLLDDRSRALPAIREFLTASRLDDAPVWRDALDVDDEQVAEQTRADGLGALPWGAISALYRQVAR